MTTQGPTAKPDRRVAIADSVIELLAARTSRRVTHRAVDRELALAEGSTSAYFRTRATLLAAAAKRLAERDHEALEDLGREFDPDAAPKSVAHTLAAVVDEWTSDDGAVRQLARLELQLEARTLPELADSLAVQRASFLRLVEGMLRAAGPDRSPDEVRLLASAVVALVEGLISDRLLNTSDGRVARDDLPRALELLTTFGSSL
ncbi:TetR family transcriptional regulator [Rhodococcus fascians]|nr:TetR family transcriptional regulator [Rhodococcus fascians]MBY4417284.1 TetR family transcriptional regulator [Rhodococcus fascians]